MLLCHIVGLNNISKREFDKYCSDLSGNVIIEDIDEISKAILDDPEYSSLITAFRKDTNNKVEILKQLGEIWKTKIGRELAMIVENSKTDNIVLVGLTHFVLDQRIKIDIPTKHKFFININPKENAKQIVSYNLERYANNIINGRFPLHYLDHEYLIDQRANLQKIYENKGYTLKRYNALLQWLSFKNDTSFVNSVFYASPKRYEKHIISFAKPIGYTERWLALASILPKTDIKRGITFGDNKGIKDTDERKPYIKLLSLDAMTKLQTGCYLYEMIPDKRVDGYRYIVTDMNYIKREYISDIYDELQRLDVQINNTNNTI